MRDANYGWSALCAAFALVAGCGDDSKSGGSVSPETCHRQCEAQEKVRPECAPLVDLESCKMLCDQLAADLDPSCESQFDGYYACSADAGFSCLVGLPSQASDTCAKEKTALDACRRGEPAPGGTGGMGTGGGGAATDAGVDAGVVEPVEIGTFMGLTGFDHKLAAEAHVACALDASGAVVCQGDSADQWEAPAGPFARLDMGDDFACALDDEGNATCWGDSYDDSRCEGRDPSHCDQMKPPAGPFTAIGLAERAACGIRPSGYIECWGWNDRGQSEPPDGTFVDLVMDDDFGCAIATDGHIECWGGAPVARIDGDFAQVSAHAGNLCTLDRAGKVECMGFAERYQEAITPGSYVNVHAGSDNVCAIKKDGSVECFSDNSLGRLPPPVGPWVELAGNYTFKCARAEDGRAECWGPDFGDGAATLQCVMGRSVLSGTLDGKAFDADLDSSAQYSFDRLMKGYSFAYGILADEMQGAGLMVFNGDTDLGPDGVALRALEGQGEVPIDSSVLQLLATDDDPGVLHCTGAGSGSKLSLHVDEVALDLQNVHAMGTCPGTPVSGEITVCPDGNCFLYEGMLEGKDASGGLDETSFSIGAGHPTFYGGHRELFRMVTDDAGNIAWAIFVTGPESEFGGAVYCAGAGSGYTIDADTITYSLRDLSRLDACPTTTSSDSLTGCVR